MTDLIKNFLSVNPTLLFFVVIALGYLIGKLGVGGFRLGAVAGVLFVGLAFGHFGFEMGPAAQSWGFAIFIFAVGYQAGPGFFEVIRSDGLRYFGLALVVAVTGVLLAIGLSKAFEFEPGVSAGLLGGALTTTPTLAAAQEALRAGNVIPPDGFSVERAIDNVGAAYAITYLFGVVGLIVLLKMLPRIMQVDLRAAARDLHDPREALAHAEDMVPRAYRVLRSGSTVGELEGDAINLRVMQMRRSDAPLDFELGTRFEVGDELLVLGHLEALLALPADQFEESHRTDLFDATLETAEVVVERPAVVGRTLAELATERRPGGVLILGIRRLRVDLPVQADLVFRRGDVVKVLGTESNLEFLAHEAGHVERRVEETDLLTFALGIVLGILLGTLSIRLGGIFIGLGSAGGLLTSGLLVGFLRSVNPKYGRVPDAALWLLMELGLLMFMAGVGMSAGSRVVETLLTAGVPLILCGIVVTVVPVLIAYVFGTKVLRLSPVLLMGGIAGSMTSGSALKVVQETANSPAPALGYTSAYAFANVLLTVAGNVMPFFD